MCIELYRWSIELKEIFVLPLAPPWVRHSYLSIKTTIDPLYLWVIKTFFWHRCRGAIAWGEYSRVCLFALSLRRFYLGSKLFSIFSCGYGTRNTKKIGVLAAHGDEEPPKTLDARYVENVKHHFDNPKKTPFNLIMRYTLDQPEYFRDYRLTQKGKLLWDQIHMLHWYARSYA